MLRAARRGRPARRLEGVHERLPRAPPHPDGGLSHIHRRRVRARLRRDPQAADRHQGRRPCGRQRRRDRADPRRGGRNARADARAAPVRSGRHEGRDRRLPRRRRSELHRARRRRARRAARELARPQDARRRRPWAEHRRDGRVLARPGRHRRRSRARDARHHAADRARAAGRWHPLPRISLRGAHDRCGGQREGGRVQLPARRSGDAADPVPAALGPRAALPLELRRHAWANSDRLGSARDGRRRDREPRLPRRLRKRQAISGLDRATAKIRRSSTPARGS